MSESAGPVVYVGPHPAPVQGAVERAGAGFYACGGPEDAVTLLRQVRPKVALLHTPEGRDWLPMLRSNRPECLFVLLAVPPQMTAELTHPWSIVDGRLDAPIADWLAGSASRQDTVSRRAPADPTRRWVLLTLDSEGQLTRAYGWTAYTGQTEEEAKGLGWLGMLDTPQIWQAQMRGKDHLQIELGLYNQRAGEHHRCSFRCVRTTGWTVHIDDRQREYTRARKLDDLERAVEVLRNDRSRLQREVVQLEATVAEVCQAREQLLHALQRPSPAAATLAQLGRVLQQLRVAKDSLSTLSGAPDGPTRAAAVEAVQTGLHGALESVAKQREALRLQTCEMRPTTVRLSEIVREALGEMVVVDGDPDMQLFIDAGIALSVLRALEHPDRGEWRLSVQPDGLMAYLVLRPLPRDIGLLRTMALRHGGTFGLLPAEAEAPQRAWFTLPTAVVP